MKSSELWPRKLLFWLTNQRIAWRLPDSVTWAWCRKVCQMKTSWSTRERTVHSLFTLQHTWKKKRVNFIGSHRSPTPFISRFPLASNLSRFYSLAQLGGWKKYKKIEGYERSNWRVQGAIDDGVFVFYSRSPARGGSIMPMIFVFRGMFLNTSTMMSSALPHTNWAFVTPAEQQITLESITLQPTE